MTAAEKVKYIDMKKFRVDVASCAATQDSLVRKVFGVIIPGIEL